MVHVVSDPAVPHTASHQDDWRSHSYAIPSREEHAQRIMELSHKRGKKGPPKRGFSLTDYQGDHDVSHALYAAVQAAAQASRPAPIPENDPLPSPALIPPPVSTPTTTADNAALLPRRPRLPPPRRSYSVTDCEPEPASKPLPGSRMNLLDLPSELHYTLYDFLDPIDGVCLGLAHSRLYEIHRRKYGRVPLSSRYSGPNDMEWAWRGAGPLVGRSPANRPEQGGRDMRVKGQVYCRKCGVSRCELHRHLKDWMGEGYEYCEIKQVYGRPAREGAKQFCYMSSPKNPNRCGRHGGKKTSGTATPETTPAVGSSAGADLGKVNERMMAQTA